jgi:hypothetical protein
MTTRQRVAVTEVERGAGLLLGGRVTRGSFTATDWE